MAPTNLSLAVCLFTNVDPNDFQGPMELLSFLAPHIAGMELSSVFSTAPAVTIEATYLAVTGDPVQGVSGPRLLPDRTYESVKEGEQFDIILVPGGESIVADINMGNQRIIWQIWDDLKKNGQVLVLVRVLYHSLS
jgi:hypothetical protein